MSDIFNFQVELVGWNVPSYQSLPFYTSDGDLIGAFSLVRGDMIQGFVTANNHPAGLMISTGDKFYVTPRHKDYQVFCAILTEFKLDCNSIMVRKADHG